MILALKRNFWVSRLFCLHYRRVYLSSLTLVTLPIGNNKDITLRALETLSLGKCFYAEDTRVFKKILDNLNIDYADKFIDSFHDHTVGKIDLIVEKIKSGMQVYLVSDAGSPVISDPAFPLLKKIREAGIEIKTVPGVSSVIAALELSALPPHPFHFWGFIARTKGEKKNFFNDLGDVAGTHLFFESPHRILETITAFFEHFPEGELVITREITKVYESVYRIKRNDLIDLEKIITEKGEFVLLFHVDKKAHTSSRTSEISELINDYLEGKGGTKKLAKIFAKALDGDTKAIYDQLSRSENKS